MLFLNYYINTKNKNVQKKRNKLFSLWPLRIIKTLLGSWSPSTGAEPLVRIKV
jgi:hypothetical protein